MRIPENILALIISFGIPLAITLLVVFVFISVKNARKKFLQLLKLKLISIHLPQKPAGEGRQNIASEINPSAQLFGLLANLKIPFSLETAVHNIGEDINFYVAVPEASVNFAAKQIQGIWPDAQIQKAEDYTIFNSQGNVKAVYLGQKQNYALPIRTYVDADLDTFAPILSNFSKLEVAGEGLAIQVLVRPADSQAPKIIAKHIQHLKQGANIEHLLTGKGFSPQKPKPGETPLPMAVDDEAVKLLNQKVSKPLFRVNVRLMASAMSPYRAEELLNNLTGSFNQFAAPQRNEFKIIEPRNNQKLVFQYIFREFKDDQSMTLNADELASIWHLPISGTEVPKIKWVKSKEAPPPTVMSESGTLIGESDFRGETKQVYISDEDRRRHVYVIGQTGTGKSTLLVNMVASDIKAGKGVAIVDPHGELINSILKIVPEKRMDDVVVFDPGDLDKPLGLNMLEYDPSRPEQKTFIINEMQSILSKLFSQETMGPMFEQYMKNALLLLMDDPSEKATLMEIPRVFTDKEFRGKLLAKATNPTVIDFWTKEASKAGGEASLSNITPYVTSKFNSFVSNDYMRPIIGQPESSFNFRKVMDEGKILLVNLSKGRIGDINAGLLGMVVVGKILLSALSRVDVPQEKRKDFNLYIDEFQNFTTDSISTILSEARKYRLNLVVAHQFIAKVEEKIRGAVFGNVGSQIIFRVGADDAEFLVKQLEPVFTKNDLVNIDNFNAFAKLLIKGQTARPFNIKTVPEPLGDQAAAEKIKESSRQKYGRDKKTVEQDIFNRLRG